MLMTKCTVNYCGLLIAEIVKYTSLSNGTNWFRKKVRPLLHEFWGVLDLDTKAI